MRDFDGDDCGCVTPVANVALSFHMSLLKPSVVYMPAGKDGEREGGEGEEEEEEQGI
eukprot:COSAG01_NODE_71590_length_255_cov_0.987179_1_plen_56_part_10